MYFWINSVSSSLIIVRLRNKSDNMFKLKVLCFIMFIKISSYSNSMICDVLRFISWERVAQIYHKYIIDSHKYIIDSQVSSSSRVDINTLCTKTLTAAVKSLFSVLHSSSSSSFSFSHYHQNLFIKLIIHIFFLIYLHSSSIFSRSLLKIHVEFW